MNKEDSYKSMRDSLPSERKMSETTNEVLGNENITMVIESKPHCNLSLELDQENGVICTQKSFNIQMGKGGTIDTELNPTYQNGFTISSKSEIPGNNTYPISLNSLEPRKGITTGTTTKMKGASVKLRVCCFFTILYWLFMMFYVAYSGYQWGIFYFQTRKKHQSVLDWRDGWLNY